MPAHDSHGKNTRKENLYNISFESSAVNVWKNINDIAFLSSADWCFKDQLFVSLSSSYHT